MPGTTQTIQDLLFDWDGTLLDSERLGYLAFAKTFHDLGVSFTREWYEANYSPNWYSLYEALQLPREKWQSADQLWLTHYGEESPLLVSGAWNTLRTLAERGYRMGIVSSGSASRVLREIEKLGVASHFEVVICNEHTEQKKPHPEGLEMAIRQIQSRSESCCYIGDSPEDISMGRNANVLTIGIWSAYPGNRRMADAKPDICLKSITELLALFGDARRSRNNCA